MTKKAYIGIDHKNKAQQYVGRASTNKIHLCIYHINTIEHTEFQLHANTFTTVVQTSKPPTMTNKEHMSSPHTIAKPSSMHVVLRQTRCIYTFTIIASLNKPLKSIIALCKLPSRQVYKLDNYLRLT